VAAMSFSSIVQVLGLSCTRRFPLTSVRCMDESRAFFNHFVPIHRNML
jgi:hypothetical protein